MHGQVVGFFARSHERNLSMQAVVDANPGLHTCRSLQRTVIIGGCLSLLEVSCCCKRPVRR